jgi:hypothetical protein
MRLVRGYYRIMDQRNPAALRLARKLLEKPFDAVFRAAVAIGRKL